MSETTHADERSVARPNDELRAALLEALDIADRAGVAVSWAQGSARGGRCSSVHLQARGDDLRTMPRTDALRITLRARPIGAQLDPTSQVFDPAGRDPWLTLAATLPSTGARLEVYTQPTADELAAARDALEAATVEAVLQS